MDRKIQDYLHLYIGCEVHSPQGPSRLCSVGILGNDGQKYRKLIGGMSTTDEFRSPVDKLILRQLSDITEEETDWIKGHWQAPFAGMDSEPDIRIFIGDPDLEGRIPSIVACAEITQYLLSRSFDLFNLIPDKLAIDKTTLSL